MTAESYYARNLIDIEFENCSMKSKDISLSNVVGNFEEDDVEKVLTDVGDRHQRSSQLDEIHFENESSYHDLKHREIIESDESFNESGSYEEKDLTVTPRIQSNRMRHDSNVSDAVISAIQKMAENADGKDGFNLVYIEHAHKVYNGPNDNDTPLPCRRNQEMSEEYDETLEGKTKFEINCFKDCGLRLDKTCAFEKAVQQLGWHKLIIITGCKGCGKKIMVKELLHYFSHEDRKQDRRIPLILSNPSDWDRHVHPNRQLIIWLENVFGSAGIFDKERFRSWECVFRQILNYTQNLDSVLILTTLRRKIWIANKCFLRQFQIFNDFAKYKFDLSFEYTLSSPEKLLILKEYFKFALGENITKVKICTEYRQENLEAPKSCDMRISERTLENISRISSPVGFLGCCFEFVKKNNFIRRGVDFFHRPFELFIDEINYLNDNASDEENCHHYLMLLLIVLHDGKFSFDNSFRCREDSEMFSDFCKLCTINSFDKNKVLNYLGQRTVCKFSGIYFNYNADNNCCTFAHESFSDAVCLSVASKHDTLKICIPFVLKKCSSQLLINYVQIKKSDTSQNSDRNLSISVSKKDFLSLSMRFIKEIFDKKFDIVSIHPSLDNREFVKYFFELLSCPKFYTELLQKETSPYYGLLWYLFNQEQPKLRLAKCILKNPPNQNERKRCPLNRKSCCSWEDWWEETKINCMWAACHLGHFKSLELLKDFVMISDKHLKRARRMHDVTKPEFVEKVKEYKLVRERTVH